MLNGKFFTGLPPKMIDRGSTGGRNRMESHLFWPDDTKVDTAIESRLKRRNSTQLACTEKPLYEKQNSALDDVDTRKRFSKEFSQSSIQFYDNLNANTGNSKRAMLRNSVGSKKMEVAEKPTNTKLQLPNNTSDEVYTAAKNKQTFTSKIQFYDYANEQQESQNNRNNIRKPKMDMNNKREMELNSKNSPKLQVKRDVRSLSEEKERRKLNNRDVGTANAHKRSDMNDTYNERNFLANNEENYLINRRSVEPKTNVNPKTDLAKSYNNPVQRHSNESETYKESIPSYYNRRRLAHFENPDERNYKKNHAEPDTYYESDRFAPREYKDNCFYRSRRDEPQRIIRTNSRQYYETPDEKDYSHDCRSEEEITVKMRDVHIKSLPHKQYFPAEEYYDDEPQYDYAQNDQIKALNESGSSYQRFDNNKTQANNPKRFINDKRTVNKINNKFEPERVVSPISPTPSDVESSVSEAKSQKHLRSSLCFNNGEIIGENDVSKSPTSTQYPTQRRNARSSATQRVSVGLPD